MTKPPPSLALDMSQDGIALHQLAFDGHWHELARVALNDAALRERLANMRAISTRLEGRRFKTRIWLPQDQIIQKNIALSGSDDTSRLQQARADIAAKSGGKPGDFSAHVGARQEDGTYAVAAVRLRTLYEAKTFAKSHGFRARGYSTQAAVAGFSTPPNFEIPADKVKIAGLGLVAATAATLVLGGGYAFYTLDPFNMWEIPPKAADFAPFQQPNPGIERAGAPSLPARHTDQPVFPLFSAFTTNSVQYALPYLPPRQLTADALDLIIQPSAPFAGSPPEVPAGSTTITVNWPADIQPLGVPGAADQPPALGLINLLGRVSDLTQPALGTPPAPPSGPTSSFASPPRPMTVANTAFFLEPLPAMATRLSPAALTEFIARSGLTVEQLSRMASPLLLIESKLVEVTPGLPPILPRLRSGRAIPEQVAPPVVVEPAAPVPPAVQPTGPAPLFTIVQGPPAIRPAQRSAPPVVVPPADILPFQLIDGAPDTRPAFRVVQPQEETRADPEIVEEAPQTDVEIAEIVEPAQAADVPDPASDVPVEDIALANAVDAAIAAALPPTEPSLFTLVSGQPTLLPRLRSGASIPPLVLTNAAGQVISPETAEANNLRPRRRPQAIIDMPAPIDPMVSGAAPITAVRASHRNENFAANAARIAETAANRPRATAPVVPADPQSVNLPSSASVARAATIENAINLRQTNLLGIFGTADARTALIMLSGGRMVRVQIGQSFSGWTVVAISEDTVRIKKRNREEILRMPAE